MVPKACSNLMPGRPQLDPIRPSFAPTSRASVNLQVDLWGGQDLNLPPTDHESAPARFGYPAPSPRSRH